MRSRLFFLLVLFVASGSTPVGQTDEQFVDAIALMKRSVGMVACFTPNADGTAALKIPLGTAFFLSATGDFVTAAHVIIDIPVDDQCPFKGVYLPLGGWN